MTLSEVLLLLTFVSSVASVSYTHLYVYKRQGDIGAVAKLVSAKTGVTLCDASRVVKLPAATFPLPSLFMARCV